MMITPLTELEQRLAGPDGKSVHDASVQALRALHARSYRPLPDQGLTADELIQLKTLRTACDIALETLAKTSHSIPTGPDGSFL